MHVRLFPAATDEGAIARFRALCLRLAEARVGWAGAVPPLPPPSDPMAQTRPAKPRAGQIPT